MNTPLLSVRNLSVRYPVHTSKKWPWSDPAILHAVSNINFDIFAGQTLGIVGESGCGKSTLARAITQLAPAHSGEVRYEGKNLLEMNALSLRPYRHALQMIYQDPQASLNPRMTVGEILAEPLLQFFNALLPEERKIQMISMLERVGLGEAHLNRYPHEFSGGQCQRIGIARALLAKPRLLICDEPVSALDVSIQAQVINLLKDLQSEMNLTMIFIAHDIGIVHNISDEILVMVLGRSVEYRPADDLIADPRHPFTKALLAAVPVPDPDKPIDPAILDGDPPGPLDMPTGCVFVGRCPVAVDTCHHRAPSKTTLGEERFYARCDQI